MALVVFWNILELKVVRNLGLPYRATNPRTVRGARKRGWSVVRCGQAGFKNGEVRLSWMGLNIWAESACRGYWVSSFHLGEFAFEDPVDATAYAMKWGNQ